MGYRTILVHVDASERTRERIEIAAKLAISCNAHLIGAAASGVSGLMYLPSAIGENNMQLTVLLEYLEARAMNALTSFESIAQKLGVASFESRVADDEAGLGISLQARYADFVIIGQTDPNDPSPALRTDFPEHVVMNAARPVLIVPYTGRFDTIGKRVLVAWDASMEATRAVTAAIPLLRRAEAVQIAIFNASSKVNAHGQEPGADIALYLARHDIKVEILPQVLSPRNRSSDMDIGNALLSHAADFNADMLVMGGYAHSRFREVLLGGVTNTILKSMTIPTLMAH